VATDGPSSFETPRRRAAPQDEDLAVLGPAISFGKWPEICMDVVPITANLGGVGA